MYKYKKIAYFVVSPFKDTGNVVEYFVNNSQEFYLYIYPPSYKNHPSFLYHYKNTKLISTKEMWLYKGNNKIMIHLYYYFYYFYILIRYQIRNAFIIFYFPQFLFLNSIVNLLTANKFVFWIWDYFPNNKGIMKIYNNLVMHYNNHLKYVLYLSPMLYNIYNKGNGSFSSSNVRCIVSFGIKEIKLPVETTPNLIGYIGNLRPGQGLEFILNEIKENGKLSMHFIGDGPLRYELEQYVKIHDLSKRVKFFGFVNNQQLLKLAKKWEVAVAPYIPSKENPTIYTDPGKIKLYLELGIPVIMTKVSFFYKELIKYHAGVGIELNNKSFIDALITMQKDYLNYKKGVHNLCMENQYEAYYDKKFKFLNKNDN